jgi:hypothetical protein
MVGGQLHISAMFPWGRGLLVPRGLMDLIVDLEVAVKRIPTPARERIPVVQPLA